jgi:hypothetical protein
MAEVLITDNIAQTTVPQTEIIKRQITIDFVKYPSKVPWCSDFLYNNLERYSAHELETLHPNRIGKTSSADFTHFVNIQLLNKISPFFGRGILNKIGKQSKIIAGVRGEFGLPALIKWEKYVDHVVVNVDKFLIQKTMDIAKDVIIIGEGADPEIFFPSPNKPEEFKIAWMGRAHKSFKNAQFLPLLGSPILKASYDEYIPHHKVAEMLRESSVLINMSESEGFCRPILEAAMCGLPVISHDVGIASTILDPEFVVADSPRVDLKPYLNLLDYLRKDPDEAWRIGSRNLKRGQNYTWKNIIRQYDIMYELIGCEYEH